MTSTRSTGSGRRFAVGPSLPLLPFFVFVAIFLFVPTITVIVGAFQGDQGFTVDNLRYLGSDAAWKALRGSLIVSAASALIGAVVGGLVAYIISSSSQRSLLRRLVVAVSGVLAQFGGVTLAFAFTASYAVNGVMTLAWLNWTGMNLYGNGWLFTLLGLTMVYSYFQIPLMVIVFLPALEGLRPQWREAALNLGATTRQYWLEVGLPLLRPAFLGSALLLFANAFAAYATVAALIASGGLVTPLLIRQLFTSEVVLGGLGQAKALALEMVVVVALVMALYSWLLRRTARWMR